MTLRIDTERDGRLVSVRLAGRLRGEDLPELECELADERGLVVLDLEEVDLADIESIRFLGDAERAGIELRNCPPFIRAWIVSERDGGG